MLESETNILSGTIAKVVSGPRLGQKLKPTNLYIAYWFAWVTFYPNIEIIE